MDLSVSHKLFRNIKNNRWQHEFHDREKIGAGGFASVYKVKNCYDDHVYAVKKVKLQFKDIRRNFEQELQKVLDEAKFLAKVKHENILRYYGSWLEATTRPCEPIIKNSTIKPSLFKKEKENFNSLNIEVGNFNHDDDNHDDNSPAVIFSDTDKANEDNEAPCFFDFQKDEKKSFVNNGSFAKKRPGFNAKRLNFQEGLKIHPKLRVSTSQPEECSTPLVRGEKLENIMLFIQTELCSNTLESYIDARNSFLQDLKKQDAIEYTKKRNEYLREALCFAKQVLKGISHIHSHHVVHRDLKPSNIFIAGKTCKIGDFGLVKQLMSLYPVENSPFVQESEKVLHPLEESFHSKALNRYDKMCLITKKSSSDPSLVKKRAESSPDSADNITKSIGTRMYASPEQWLADKDTFDCRADIFSLGICFLLLFHPMSTYMEKANIIKDSKDGNIPEGLEKELPEIAQIIKEMLSQDPAARPCIDKITESLKLPISIKSQICGNIRFRKENASRWRKKYFKVIDGNLHLYNRESEKKAENIYSLTHWKISLEGSEKLIKQRESIPPSQIEHSQSDKPLSRPKEVFVRFENPEQLGCEFKAGDLNRLNELFKAFQEFKNTA